MRDLSTQTFCNAELGVFFAVICAIGWQTESRVAKFYTTILKYPTGYSIIGRHVLHTNCKESSDNLTCKFLQQIWISQQLFETSPYNPKKRLPGSATFTGDRHPLIRISSGVLCGQLPKATECFDLKPLTQHCISVMMLNTKKIFST